MNQETRKGGLGRGLAALITSSPRPDTRIGSSAADVVFGPQSTNKDPQATETEPKAEKATNGTGKSKNKKAAKAKKSADKNLAAKNISDTGRVNPIIAQAIQDKAQQEASTKDQVDQFGASYQEIPIGLLIPNDKNPRQVFDEDDLGELVHSISEFGLLQPIVVRSTGDGRYEIIMGERRWRASSKAGLKTIPAIVRQTDDSDMLRDALLENIHRVQLNPLEEAAAYQQLLEEFGVTKNELADKLGRSRPMISNMIRLLGLPVSVQRKVAAGVLSAGHARAILGLKQGEQAQITLAERVIAEGMSVRATEEAVTLLNRGEEKAQPVKRAKAPTPQYFSQAAQTLADDLDTKVSVTVGKRKGRIVVEFGGRDDFDRIMEILKHQ
ncbi:ParB/RepB/Spo0J family partition protein [Corynebacterium sp. sy017]|uniref:ParB/RepB/Spo0J family partition protein n=1 Tax=unclassified Corynebacterium TaxID=2624378 RepID=UPI0011851418|nr:MULTISPECIES: ParB/RepB/Spo0J family partition protein [unclassified Corynebacterium]MBP3088261.1 ParB/RepB/Spo0J family partition protein [Corynebacterium sp. sy017]QDZ43441.1 ParB/RepB/Spo0J family partition protein [Corynebacterium sp. sy039]TSD91587.1 ParB/RepB/Spo0J family partition protein [Corynebacterium sp. SY003]